MTEARKQGRIMGTRFLCKKPVPEPSGKNPNIFTVNWKCTHLSCAGAQMSHFSSLRRNRMGKSFLIPPNGANAIILPKKYSG